MMSKDRVQFTLPPRYFQSSRDIISNGFKRDTMMRVLRHALGMTYAESANLFDQNPGGFTIECRLSQFARFIVLQYETMEGINGIKDLNPKIMPEQRSRNLYERVSDELNVPSNIVRRVAEMLHAAYIGRTADLTRSCCVDVSDRPAQHDGQHQEPHWKPRGE